MNLQDPKPKRPWWVALGLWGVHERMTAWIFVAICIGASIFCLFKGITEWPLLFGGVFFLLAAGWYYACIRWVDAHGEWK